jgi:methionyl-tRNA formyltransferase
MHDVEATVSVDSPVLRVVLMGTGPFAVPSFEALCQAGHDCLLVITRPERTGPGSRPAEASPVRKWAESRGLPVEAPESMNTTESVQLLESLQPDLLVVCDFGQILKPGPLAAAKLGGINLHGSLLPSYRGAAPVQWAVLNGDEETGVSVIHMTPRLDAGPVIAFRRTSIGPQETSGTLEERLSRLGVEATLEAVAKLIAAKNSATEVAAVPQEIEKASKAPRLNKTDGRILWARSARELDFHVRGMQPWPGAFTEVPLANPSSANVSGTNDSRATPQPGGGLRLVILEIESTGQLVSPDLEPGTIAIEGNDFLVACGDQWVRILRLKPAGKREMTAAEWLRGRPIQGSVVLR